MNLFQHQRNLVISIHAPRTGSDGNRRDHQARGGNFNPRSPHGERPFPLPAGTSAAYHFNPRSPHGERRYITRASGKSPKIFQSTLPARGATLSFGVHRQNTNYFNPRSPHGERLDAYKQQVETEKFQSTLPARGATDVSELTGGSLTFQSTLPARGATETINCYCMIMPFQSTLPARGATIVLSASSPMMLISIHAPRTGSDSAK